MCIDQVQIQGLVLLGTSMDYESSEARASGCWDPKSLLTGFYDNWCSTTPTPEFVVDDVWCGMVATLGFGAGASEELVQFWKDTLKQVYRGDEGRKKLKMALGCLLDRDGLLRRIRDVKCPVYWLQVCCAATIIIFQGVVMELTHCREPRTRRLV